MSNKYCSVKLLWSSSSRANNEVQADKGEISTTLRAKRELRKPQHLETTKLTILAYPRCVEVFVPTQEFFIFSFDWQSPLFQTKQERNKERLTSSHSHIFCSFSLNLTSHISSRSSWFLNHGGSGCIVDSQFCEVAMSLRTLLFHDLKVRFYYIIVFYSYLISNIK